MGYTNDYIKYLGSTDEPVKTFIKEKVDITIVEVEDLERRHVVRDFQKRLGWFCYICFVCLMLASCFHYNTTV